MRAAVFGLMGMLATSPVLAQEKVALACVETDSTGFYVKDGAYEATKFKTVPFTMIVEGTTLRMQRSDHEEVYQCIDPWQTKPHLLDCHERFYSVMMNMNTYQFVYARYYGSDGPPMDSIGLSYGQCQRM